MQHKPKKQKLRFTLTTAKSDGSFTRVPFNYFSKSGSSGGIAGSTSSKETTSDVCQLAQDAEECPASSTAHQNKSDHGKRCRKEEETKAWQEIRGRLHSTYMESIVPWSQSCQTCKCHLEEPVVCYDCICMSVMCSQCAKNSHTEKLQFHNLIQFKDGLRVKFEFVKELYLLRHDCQHKYIKAMDVFDNIGALHSCQVTFCRCYTEAEALVRCGFWPSSPKEPQCALSIEMLTWMKSYMLETKSSIKSICQALKWHHHMPEETMSYLYRVLMRETFEEFRHFQFKTSYLPLETDDLYDASSCPACPKDDHDGDLFISFDANFGLVRKKNSGTSVEPPKHGSRYFIDQAEVDTFVDKYSGEEASKQELEQCNNFQATNVVRSKNKAVNLDAKGVFGSACRHGVPGVFLSMRHGERFAYPALVMMKLLEGSLLHHHIIYDVACKFDAHLKKNMPELSGYDVALPVFHAYGHKFSCQKTYSTRWKSDYGLTDGECMERLWSYLRKFSHITKEMTPSHRIDLLSDALLHYAVGKISSLGTSLCLSIMKGKDVMQQSNTEIQGICASFGVSTETIRQWRCHDVAGPDKKAAPKSTWKQVYVKNIDIYQQLSLELALTEDPEQITILSGHITRIQETLEKTEKKKGIQNRWATNSQDYQSISQELEQEKKKGLLEKMRSQAVEYVYLKEISRKYSDGQAIAHRVTGQISRTSRSLKASLNAYNKCFSVENPVPFSLAADPMSDIYCHLSVSQQMDNRAIPFSVRRRAVDALNLHQRASEECKIVATEMENFVKFFSSQAVRVNAAICQLGKPSSLKEEGLLLLLKEREHSLLTFKESCEEQFRLIKEGNGNIDSSELAMSDEDDTDEELQ